MVLGGMKVPAAVAFALVATPTVAIRAPSRSDAKDPCACRKWNEHFSQMGGSCTWMGREYCYNFYKRINSSACMELNWGEEFMSQTQVCPVSNECEDLQGGREYNHNKFKKCGYFDEQTRHWKYKHAVLFAKEHNIDPGHMARVFFPKIRWVRWPKAKGCLVYPKHCNMKEDTRADLMKMVGHNETKLIDSLNGEPPYGIISYREIYEITNNEEQLNLIKEQRGDPGNNYTISTCLQGCEGQAKWHPTEPPKVYMPKHPEMALRN